MADDDYEAGRTFQSERGPLRRDITYEELAALIGGASIDDVLKSESKSEEKTSDSVVDVSEDAEMSASESTFEVQEVADTFVREMPTSLENPEVTEAAAVILEPAAQPINYEEEESISEKDVISAAPDDTVAVEESNTDDDFDVPLPDETGELSSAGRLLRGSFWLTAGGIGSRLLGALYIIPWVAMIGAAYSTSANSLYAQGYQIYSVFLLIATAGLPNVLSRLVAEFQAQHDFRTVKHLLRQSLILGGVMGLAAGLLLYVLAGPLSQGRENVVPVLQSLAFAVAVIPLLSMLRGYIQGFEFMQVSAASQFIEQLVRVVYMLGATYYIMVMAHGSWVDATVQSTFAAFWGALAGIAVVVFGILRRRDYFASQEVLSITPIQLKTGEMMWRMVRQALPIVIASSAVALVQVFDQYTFFKIIEHFTSFTFRAADDMYAQFAFNSNKLVMLVVSLTLAMAETTVPMMARAKSIGDRAEIGKQITQALRLLSFVLVPAALGLAAIAHPIYVIFYGTGDMDNGIMVLQYASFTSLVLGVYMIVLAVFQGLGELRYTLKFFGIILVAKIVLQVPLTIWFVGMGPLIATMFAFGFGMYFAVRRLSVEYPIDWPNLNFDLLIILFWSMVMYVAITPVVGTIEIFVRDTRLIQFVVAAIGVLIGTVIYGLVALKTRLGVEILGPRDNNLAEKLHLK
jgi:O-antigen/teichoic acid export membrane protein